MRSFTTIWTVGAALVLTLAVGAQPPGYEVRTYVDDPLDNFDPTAPAATTENTLKEPYICPYCGYSTGGTWDTSGTGTAPWDTDDNGIPDEAEGVCPNPWDTPGHPANVTLVPARPVERFFEFRWLGAPLALTLIRGVPFKPGEIDDTPASGPTNEGSRVRVRFAFDPANAGDPDFQIGTQVRFLLIPPGVARPTARYHSLRWEPGGSSAPGNPAGSGEWGEAINVAGGAIRIGVHPWRAVDGDVYHMRVRMEAPDDGDELDVQVWSETNGLEFETDTYDGTTNDLIIYCNSGAVRITIPEDTFQWYDDGNPGDDPDPAQYWAFRWVICNNSRIMPNLGDSGPASDPNWITDPSTPDLDTGSLPADPTNYFVASALGGGRGEVADTDPLGGVGPTLDDSSALEFRLRPGETGTGMVAVLWRNDPANMWSYDEDESPEGPASAWDPASPVPVHTNGIQPVAARFFCSRISTGGTGASVVTVSLPEGAPGGQTDPGTISTGTDLEITNRQVGEIARCPLHDPNMDERQLDPGSYTNTYIDPLWAGGASAGNGEVVGRGPGGDAPADHTPGAALPSRTVGCGAVHWIDDSDPATPPIPCWCGRTHNPSDPESMFCNYCGTRLLWYEGTGGPGNDPAGQDAERAATSVDLDAPLATTSHQITPDPLRLDAVYTMAAEAIRGTKIGITTPGGVFVGPGTPSTLTAVANPLFACIPQFQLPSFGIGPGGIHTNGTPQPYQGAFVAYRVADEDHPWFESVTTGAHDRFPSSTAASPRTPIFDANGQWDIFYRCPDCGNRHSHLALSVPLTGALPYVYQDQWSATDWPTELECSYGRGVGATAPNTGAEECPGHQICPTCGCAWEAIGEGTSPTEAAAMMLTLCPFDGTPLVNADTAQTRFIPDYLSAEEFDPLIIQAEVMRKTRLAANQPTIDLGRLAPGVTSFIGFPSDVSPIAVVRNENQSNHTVSGVQLMTQGLVAVNPTAPGDQAITTAIPERLVLVRTDAVDSPEDRSPHRVARSIPITGERLYASSPDSPPVVGNWATGFAPGYRGNAAGESIGANMRAGTLAGLPIPTGVGSGNYSGSVLAFVDTNGNGALDFLDRSQGLVGVTSLTTRFDATEDYPLEPVVPLNLRMRVVETPLLGNTVASDASPSPLFLDTNSDGLHDRLEVVWESNVGGAGTPHDAVNLRDAITTPAGGPGVARDLSFPASSVPITADTVPGTVNGSPETYRDPAGGLRWLLWHKLSPTATDIGFSSTLWSASAPADGSVDFGSAGTANFIFDTSLDKSWIRGFINPLASAPANHWSFWNSGKRGKEEIHFCNGADPSLGDAAGYNPLDPLSVSDRILAVSNGVSANAKEDWAEMPGMPGVYIRKPSKSPFTYVKDASPIMQIDPTTGVWNLHTFFSGYVPQEHNADICYVKFVLAEVANREANYGKIPHSAIVGPYGGEELQSDGVRQTFGSRHLDWITTRRLPRAAAGADFMAAPLAGVDPEIFIHLVGPGIAPTNRDIYAVTWPTGAGPLRHRYNRSQGTYRLTDLVLTQVYDGSPSGAGSYTPVEPVTGNPLEMYVDPAAGLIRFSAPLFNVTNPSDPRTYFNAADFPGLVDVQIWVNYVPYVYRICRDDANDDSPSAFFDYADITLASPGGLSPADLASLGRFVVFWRRSYSSADAPHFGRTSFMYKTYTTAIQVHHPPINAISSVTDVTPPGGINVSLPLPTDADGGIIGIPPTLGGVSTAGHRMAIAYDSASRGSCVEYHLVQGWSQEQRVNVDSVYSEGPLVVEREWYAVNMTDSLGNTGTEFLSRYWLFWTSPRGCYNYDPSTVTGGFFRSRDVYYATVVPEWGTSVTERHLPSR
ncbi:MAG: hypothetical protein ACUVX8_13440 [Candidatus Zipacnadales bacterium]